MSRSTCCSQANVNRCYKNDFRLASSANKVHVNDLCEKSPHIHSFFPDKSSVTVISSALLRFRFSLGFGEVTTLSCSSWELLLCSTSRISKSSESLEWLDSSHGKESTSWFSTSHKRHRCRKFSTGDLYLPDWELLSFSFCWKILNFDYFLNLFFHVFFLEILGFQPLYFLLYCIHASEPLKSLFCGLSYSSRNFWFVLEISCCQTFLFNFLFV